MNHFEKVVIRASAGSGKTFQLSNRYIRLLFDGVPVDQILAITFTRMAAGEIRDRVFSRLGKAALSESQTKKLIQEVFGDDPNSEHSQNLGQEDVIRVLQGLVQNLHRLRISTLDSFGNQIAKSFSLELGLPVDWGIAQEVDENKIRVAAVLTTLRVMKANVALRLMNMLPKGETSKRVADDLYSTVKGMIAYVRNSTLKAWTKLPHCPVPDMSAVPGLIDRLRQGAIPRTNEGKGPPDKVLLRQRDKLVDSVSTDNIQESLICSQKLYNSLVKKANQKNPIPNILQGDLAVVVEEITQIMLSRQMNLWADQTGSLYPIVSRVAKYMDDLKYESGHYQFEDVPRLLAQWIAGRKSSNDCQTKQLVFRLDATTKHLFLDEFQDTSLEQWKFIRPFVEGILSKPDGTSFFCVGDVKQAIYGWRNGLVEIFNRVEQLVHDRSPNNTSAKDDSNATSDTARTPSTSLVVNWRSCNAVIDVVNKLFGSLKKNEALIGDESKDEVDNRKRDAARDAADHWSLGFEEHKTANREGKSQHGLVTVEVAPLFENEPERIREIMSRLDPQRLLSNTEDDESETTSNAYNQNLFTLATAVARIRQLCQEVPNASIGIVTRTNKTVGTIATALRGYGIEVSEEGGSPLHDVASVRTLLAALTLADHPGDTTALYQVTRVTEFAKYLGIPTCLTEEGTDNGTDQWKKAGLRVSTLLRERIASCGLGTVVAQLAAVLSPLCNEREAERLDRVCELGWGAGIPSRVDTFIELVRSKKREFSRPATVQALTIHKSKGLEFDVVVLPDLFEEFFDMKTNAYIGRDPESLDVDTVLGTVKKDLQTFLPTSPVDFKKLIQTQWQTDMEESLCNLYVAITRARYQLTMIVPPHKDDKYTSRTYANIVRSGLGITEGNNSTDPQIVYSQGNPLWYEHVSFAPKTTRQDSTLIPVSDALTRMTSTVEPITRKLYVSPSQSATLKWSNPLWYSRGTALHRCFQEVQWLDRDGLPDERLLTDALEQLPGPKVDPKMIIAEFKTQCENPDIRDALSLRSLQDAKASALSPIGCARASSSAQWEVYAERPFTFMRHDGRLARGIIDRLVLLRDQDRVVGAEIVDYKSDRLEDFDPHGTISDKNARLFEKYSRQLSEYENVVRKWYHLQPDMIAKKLLFVSCGIVVPVAANVQV